VAIAPSHFKRHPSSGNGVPWWAFLLGILGLLGLLNPLLPYASLRFEPHHLAVLAGLPVELPWPWVSPAIGVLGLASFAGVTQRLFALPHKPLVGPVLISSSSVGVLVMLLSPSVALLQWAFTMAILYLALRWWQWRVATHASPLSPWQGQDVAMGVGLGVLGASVGGVSLFLCVGSLALWFMKATSRRFTVLSWWENYRGVTVSTLATLMAGTLIGALLGRGWGALAPLQAMPCDLSMLENSALFGVNLLMMSFPWNGVIAYAVWNWVSNLSYHGKEGQLFDERDVLLHQVATGWGLGILGLVTYALVSHHDLSYALLLGVCLASWYGGHIIDRSTQLLVPPKGLKRLCDLMPLFLLGLGVLGAWSMLTQVPDPYLSDAPWMLTGAPVVGGGRETASHWGAVLGQLPLWKLWLLTLPLWCLIGSAGMVSLQFVTFSMYRTMAVFAGWSVIYTILLFAVQWPITHPPYFRQQQALLDAFEPRPTPQNTLVQGMPPYLFLREGTFLPTPLYGLSSEARFYQERSTSKVVTRQAVQLLPVHYMGISRSTLLYYSLLDILPFLSHVGVHHFVLEYLPVRGFVEPAVEEAERP
jgi:hypothetical protein